MSLLESYSAVAGKDFVDHLRQLGSLLKGVHVVHVNSTRVGGGVAEILTKLVPLQAELGLNVRWEIIHGEDKFYECTKKLHNALQGKSLTISDSLLDVYEKTNAQNAEELRNILEQAEIVIIHDPQPLPLLKWCPNRKGKWIWRCHIDLSRPFRQVWKYLRKYALDYDASVFSLADFAQPLPHTQYLITPSIDPLSDKNKELDEDMVKNVRSMFNIHPENPMLLQVSRFDRFKDPVGVIRAYRLIKKFSPYLQLVLAGGGAADDPEGEAAFAEVRSEAAGDPDIHLLQLSPDSHLIINALQRSADIIIQKSVREGFGLTVTEGMWKSKPVIGGNTGGIRLQLINHHTGFLVSTPEGAALRVRYLLQRPEKLYEIGRKAKEFVRQNFLNTHSLTEYLTLMVALVYGGGDRIELGGGFS